MSEGLFSWLFSSPATNNEHASDTEHAVGRSGAAAYYPTSAHDAYHAAFLLRQRLVPDLVAPILDMAEYWPVERSPVFPPPQDIRDAPLGMVVLRTKPLSAAQSRRVRRVVFTVDSNDQGWGGNPDDTGTTSGSWTWFEAHVSRPSVREFAEQFRDRGGGDHLHGWVPTDRGPRREQGTMPWESDRLMSNLTATSEPSIKTAEWRWDAEAEAERTRVRELRAGDSVALTAHASFPGWRNCVHDAAVDVYCGYVR